MNSLFASNIIYSFQIFQTKLIARSLFNYIHFMSMLTLERILNFLIMVYVTSVHFS